MTPPSLKLGNFSAPILTYHTHKTQQKTIIEKIARRRSPSPTPWHDRCLPFIVEVLLPKLLETPTGGAYLIYRLTAVDKVTTSRVYGISAGYSTKFLFRQPPTIYKVQRETMR